MPYYYCTLGPVAPRNLRVARVAPTEISLEWDEIPCLERNAKIEHYRIFGRDTDSGNPIRTGVSLDNMYTATGLTTDTEYSFFVYAFYFDNNNIPRSGSQSDTLNIFTSGKVSSQCIVVCKPFSNIHSII